MAAELERELAAERDAERREANQRRWTDLRAELRLRKYAEPFWIAAIALITYWFTRSYAATAAAAYLYSILRELGTNFLVLAHRIDALDARLDHVLEDLGRLQTLERISDRIERVERIVVKTFS